MSTDLKKIEDLKNSVENSAWKCLDDFFKKTNPEAKDHDKAKIAIMAIATKIKSEMIELNERRLVGPKKDK